MKKTKILISTILGVATIGIASQQLYANSEDRISGHNDVDSVHTSQYPPTTRALSMVNALHPMLLEAMNHEATSAVFFGYG